MSRSILLVTFVLVGGLAFVGGLAAVSGSTAGANADAALAQEEIDPDDVLLSIDVATDGDAAWEIEYRVRLETEEDELAFEEFREDLEANPDEYRERFRERMEATADDAAQATGREMAITDVEVVAERRALPREYGVVTYSFRWSEFAAVSDDRLVVGDAIDGLFLDEETALVISWPEAYRLVDASPAPTETRDRSVVWIGPTNFAGGEPRVTIEPEGVFPAVSPELVVGGALLVGGLGIAAFVVYRRRERTTPETGRDAAVDGSDVDSESEELLSNEEQVLRLVESHGGRMKQKAVAEELGWTDAKTSQVTRELREEGKLEGFRLGRENVLSLPDESDE